MNPDDVLATVANGECAALSDHERAELHATVAHIALARLMTMECRLDALHESLTGVAASLLSRAEFIESIGSKLAAEEARLAAEAIDAALAQPEDETIDPTVCSPEEPWPASLDS